MLLAAARAGPPSWAVRAALLRGRQQGGPLFLEPATEFAQSLDKSAPIWTVGRRAKEHERDGRPLARLLCPGGKRARDRYAAKKR